MTLPPTEAFATRLPAEQADQIEAAIKETETTRSDLLRRAVEYYIHRNPGDVAVFYSEGSINRLLAETGEDYE